MASWNHPTPMNIIDLTEKPGMNPKALLLGCLLSIPLWALIIASVWVIATIVQHIF